jgi:serine protease Do
MPKTAHTKQSRKHASTAAFIAVLLLTSLLSAAAIYSVYNLNAEVTSLQSQISILQTTVANSQSSSAITTAYTDNTGTSLSTLYAKVENSVVTVDCTIQYTATYNSPFGRGQTYTATEEVQGSGFVYEYNGDMVIVTNNHVIEGATTITVTFADGNNYTATILGADSSTDIAILKTNAPTSEYHPLEFASYSTLSVGESVVAIGSPYGLTGTMTSGIISALDRTITVTETTGSYEITGLIQTSAPINSGNSGGPLMTIDGKVVGITTAIVSNSDGLGFAVPSDTVLSEINKLLA